MGFSLRKVRLREPASVIRPSGQPIVSVWSGGDSGNGCRAEFLPERSAKLKGPPATTLKLREPEWRPRSASAVGSVRRLSFISWHWVGSGNLGQHSLIGLAAGPRRAALNVLQLRTRGEFLPHSICYPG